MIAAEEARLRDEEAAGAAETELKAPDKTDLTVTNLMEMDGDDGGGGGGDGFAAPAKLSFEEQRAVRSRWSFEQKIANEVRADRCRKRLPFKALYSTQVLNTIRLALAMSWSLVLCRPHPKESAQSVESTPTARFE